VTGSNSSECLLADDLRHFERLSIFGKKHAYEEGQFEGKKDNNKSKIEIIRTNVTWK